jgi:hypothetical protein
MKIESDETPIKKRGSYTTKKKLELENLLVAAKEYQFNPKKEKGITKRTANTIAELTKDVCLYPARYLDNDNTCIKCDIYEHCACVIKNLGKKKRNE